MKNLRRASLPPPHIPGVANYTIFTKNIRIYFLQKHKIKIKHLNLPFKEQREWIHQLAVQREKQ